MKTRIPRDVGTARRPGRPISAAMGTAGVTQAEADRARIRTVLRASSDWRAPAQGNATIIQTKLKVSEPGDIYEQEADRISGEVLAAPTQTVAGKTPCIRRVAEQPTGETAPAPAGVEHVLTSTGNPLAPALRQEMEQRFDWDFSR